MFDSPEVPMDEPQNPGVPKDPELTPVGGLQRKRISNYFQETDPQEEIISYGIDYTTNTGARLRLVVSSITEQKVEEYLSKRNEAGEQEDIALAMNAISVDEAQQYGLHLAEDDKHEGDVKLSDSAENTENDDFQLELPDFRDLEVDDMQPYRNAYYADLLRQRRQDVVITFEHLNPSLVKDDSVIWYVIDPQFTIAQREIHHYVAQYNQSGSEACVSVANDGSGSVAFKMWHMYIDEVGNSQSSDIGTRVVNINQEKCIRDSHNRIPRGHLCDIKVTGRHDGSVYTISGYWERDYS